MLRRSIFVVLTSMIAVGSLSAQAEPWRFRWQKGQKLTYQVEHDVTVSEVVGADKTETTTKLRLVKDWHVFDVDAAGVATMSMSLKSLRLEIRSPRGDEMVDSSDLAKSDPQLRDQLKHYLGQPLAVLRVDAVGRVVEVKHSQHGPASRFEAELPFGLLLPAAVPKPGQAWERTYNMTLEPPQGTGEKFAAVQRYVCKAVKGDTAVVGLTTTLKQPPEAAADQVPLLQMQPEGELEFDTKAGCLRSATLKVEKEIAAHQGAGSSYRFRSTYSEKRIAE